MKNLVVLSGAGMSAESGISTFRDAGGLWDKYPVEQVATPEGYARDPELVINFYNERRKQLLDVKPNRGHELLAGLEKYFNVTVITQNVDGLHQKAGSKNVLELHGSVHRNYCLNCGLKYDLDFMLSHLHEDGSVDIPHCRDCGSIVRPDVVLYEEPLNESTVNGAVRHIMNADMLIVAGTSLTVYPAAGLIRYFRGRNSVLINRDANVGDDEFSLVIHGKVGEVLGSLVV